MNFTFLPPSSVLIHSSFGIFVSSGEISVCPRLYCTSNAKWRQTVTSTVVLHNFSRIENFCGLWRVGVTVVIQFRSTDPIVCFQWIVHGVGHLAMQLQ